MSYTIIMDNERCHVNDVKILSYGSDHPILLGIDEGKIILAVNMASEYFECYYQN